MPNSVYIHIPFCKTHCPYCDFAVWVGGSQEIQKKYTQALCREIAERSQKDEITTLYFGGGTPSIMSIENLQEILETFHKHFKLHSQAEVTLETNPGTVTLEKLKSFKELGINRLSLGVQTFEEKALAKLARGHNKQDALNTLAWASEAGFENISLDLIYGLPQQSLRHWQQSIEAALEQPVQHISCYSLAIEEGTPFKKIYNDSSHPDLPMEETLVQMYEMLQLKLSEKGFEQYEVSNFARPGFQSRHNLTYWRNQEFYGFGVGAHEFTNGERKAHSKDLESYLRDPLQQIKLPCDPPLEELMLALRTKEGLNLQTYANKYGIDLLKTKVKLLQDYQKANLVELSEGRLSLTPKGFLLSTELIGNLIV